MHLRVQRTVVRARWWHVIGAAIAAATLLLAYPERAYAVHAVTPGASVNVLATTNGGAYTALNAIVFTDPGPDLAPADTFRLDAPAGFEFNPAAAGDQAVGAGYATAQINLGGGAGAPQAPVYSLANTRAQWTVSAAGVDAGGSITISGMEIRPTAGTTAAGGTVNVTIAGSATVFDVANAHPIAHVPGPLNNFLVELQGGGAIGTQTSGTAFNVQVTARDANNNTLSAGPNTFTGAGNTADLTSNVTGSAGLVTTGTFTNGLLNNHSVTLTGASNGAATITATDTAGGLGTGVEAGTSAVFTVQPAAVDNFLVELQGGGAIGTQTSGTAFNVQVTARDASNNAVSFGANNYTGAGNTVDVTSNVAGSAGLVTSAALTNGVLNNHSVTLTGTNNGAATITATDSAGGLGSGTEAGTSAVFTVEPGALDHFVVEAQGGGAIATQTAGIAFNTRITAQDANNNTLAFGTNDFNGAANTVDVTSNVAGSAGLATTAAFTNGVLASHSVTLTGTGGAATLTATDSAGGLGTGAEAGTSAGFAVQAAGGGGGGGGGGGSAATPTPTPTPTSQVAVGGNVTVQVAAATSTTISGSGGTAAASTSAGSTTAQAPAGALPAGSTLLVAPVVSTSTLPAAVAPGAGESILLAAVITAETAGGGALTSDFGQPIAVAMQLAAGMVPAGTVAGDLAIGFWDGQRWLLLPTAVELNADGSASLTANAEHFTLFAALRLAGAYTGQAPAADAAGLLVTRGAAAAASLVTALAGGGCDVTALAVIEAGAWRVHIEGAPAAINAAFPAQLADRTPFFVRCR